MAKCDRHAHRTTQPAASRRSIMWCYNVIAFVCWASFTVSPSNAVYLTAEQKLNAADLRRVARMGDSTYFNRTLHAICVPRVVGTPGHEHVKDYLVGELTALGFTVEQDAFRASAPIVGNVRFTNIVGRLDAQADRYITLACHYDSKYFPHGQVFVGAIDSAVPCAIMLATAHTLRPLLASARQSNAHNDHRVSLMLVFIDGEEAFDQWTDADSLYGSRHLAPRMADIDRIDALLLLDLIGAPNPTFYNYFPATVSLFQRMVEIERRLFEAGEMVGHRYMFVPRHSSSSIADDHLPFIKRDVPIVHLITNPFPKQWHKITDDLQHLDAGSIANFQRIIRCFTFEYLTNSPHTVNFRSFGNDKRP